jgi:hypothetical protein
LDEFPEAFRRFERVVDTDRIRTFDQLLISFRYWAGRNWKGTSKQVEALKNEAEKIGIPVPERVLMRIAEHRARLKFVEPEVEAKTWRFEWVEVKGRLQMRYRDIETGRFIKKP